MAEKELTTNPMLAGDTDENNQVFEHYIGTTEKTEQVSSYVEDTFYKPYNPDDLYQKVGDHSIYEEMMRDDQINVCIQLKKDLIMGGGWDIVVKDDDQAEISDMVYVALEENPEQALDQYLDTYLNNAFGYGFALAEKLFQRDKRGMLSLKSLKTRHPDSWLIHTDDKGNVEKYEQRQSKSAVMINPKAIMRYTPTESTVGPYGESDLRKIYSAYFTKRHITRFYSIFLEKNASPIPVARYDMNLPDTKVTTLHNIIKNFQTKTAMTIPKEIEVEFLEAKGTGDAYINGINLFNMFIGRGLFIPDLLGFSGSGSQTGGSQALGREQVEIFLKHIAKRRRIIERLINRHIVQPIIISNFGFMEKYPKFQFRPMTEDDSKEYAKIFIEAVKGKFYKPTEDEVNHLRQLLKFPEGEVELIGAGTAGGGTPFPPGMVSPSVGQPVTNPDDDEIDAMEVDENGKTKAMEKRDYVLDEKPIPIEKRPMFDDTMPEKDARDLDAQLNSSIASVIATTKPLVQEIIEDLQAQIEKKKVLDKPANLEKLKVKGLGKLQRALKKNLLDGYNKHRELALGQLIKTDFTLPLPNDKFLELLEQETFQYVGDWEYEMTKDARLAAQQAIRDGDPISSVIDFVGEDVRRQALISLERFARTKHTEVMNRARLAVYEESPVVDAYKYSAILDNRTTAICRGLHGKVFKKGEQPVPPLHFNCRSTLVPITIYQDKKIDEQVGRTPIGEFIEKNKGKGFSTK